MALTNFTRPLLLLLHLFSKQLMKDYDMADTMLSIMNTIANKGKCLAIWSSDSSEGNRQMTDKR